MNTWYNLLKLYSTLIIDINAKGMIRKELRNEQS